MRVDQTDLPGVLLITPRRFGDHRGYFCETYNERAFHEAGISERFVQDNHSLSTQPATVRGLHFQTPPAAQAKLVRCVRGAIFDVAVDIRRHSPTYGQWVGYELSAETGAQLYVPAGFAHGFMTLRPETEVLYKCSALYAPESEGALLWSDPEIGIDWPLPAASVLSEKDAVAPRLADLQSPFDWEGAA